MDLRKEMKKDRGVVIRTTIKKKKD